jgi:hypothetical protein
MLSNPFRRAGLFQEHDCGFLGELFGAKNRVPLLSAYPFALFLAGW